VHTLTDSDYQALALAEAALWAANAHTGGVYIGWLRQMARNSYTIDPTRPGPDADDDEKESLHAAALTEVKRCIAMDAISRHDAIVRGWIRNGQ